MKVTWPWGRDQVEFTLVPLIYQGLSTDAGFAKIYVWEYPEKGQSYAIGIDASDGINKDRTAVEVIRKGTMYDVCSQVAEFVTPSLNGLEILPFVMALAALYSPDDEVSDDPVMAKRRQCRIAIEMAKNGDQLQLQLRLRGYGNFHPWQRNDGKQLNASQFNKFGIFTNQWFRSAMMELVCKMIRDMEVRIYSPFLIRELQTLEGDWDRQSLKASKGAHDDRFMAFGFSIMTIYQWEKDRLVPVQRPLVDSTSHQREYAVYTPGAQEMPYVQERYGIRHARLPIQKPRTRSLR